MRGSEVRLNLLDAEEGMPIFREIDPDVFSDSSIPIFW